LPRQTPSLEKLREIAKEIPTPFHLYDAEGIRQNARALYAAFAWNEGYREYFAVKAAPTPALLRLLKAEGCGVDCASLIELQLAERCGFRGEEIFFSSNVTPACEYEYAHKLGAIINLDDLTDVAVLEKLGILPERVVLRYNPGGEFRMGNKVMDHPDEQKYGMTPSQIKEAAKRLMALGVKSFGVHAFLASNTTDDAYYPTLARILFEVVKDLHEETGARADVVNLSGGIGIPYRPGQRAADIAAIGEGVRKAYEDVIVKGGLPPLRIATELGRFMTGPYGWLVTTVIHRKDIWRHYLGLDACAADLMRPAMYKAYHHITIPGKEHLPDAMHYDVTGSLCENNDKFAIDRPLPETEIGDLLVIHDTGAHGHSMGYNYNGKLRSAEVLLEADGSFKMIRRAETAEDYFATTKGF